MLMAVQLGTVWRWPKTRIEYGDNSLPLYLGNHADVSALESDPNWEITKRVYNGLGLETASEVRVGSWTNRAALGWGI